MTFGLLQGSSEVMSHTCCDACFYRSDRFMKHLKSCQLAIKAKPSDRPTNLTSDLSLFDVRATLKTQPS